MWRSEIPNEFNKKRKRVLVGFLLLSGFFIRFYLQFVEWSFNGDEVDLGLEIISNSFQDLFYPFKSRQSAPPLFLLLQKLLIPVAKPYISLKIVSFVFSCGSLIFFHRIIKNHFPLYLQILLLALFAFNPFVIGNSLTLKQYSLDLTLGLVAVNYFIKNRNNCLTFIFFSVFCLFSNVGLFFCASLGIFHFLKFLYEKKDFYKWKDFKSILLFLLAPVPYLLYFIWFMQQPGAEEMRNYMTTYWSIAFVPLDFSIFKWFAIQAKVITLFFISSYWLVGIPVFLIFLTGIFFTVKSLKGAFQNRLLSIIVVYIITVMIHLLLSTIKMYPFADRLFLYLSPGIYLILGFGILQLKRQVESYKLFYYSSLPLPVFIVFLYFTYLPVKTNDVKELLRFINSTKETVAFTSQAKMTSSKWLHFTNYDSFNTLRLMNAEQLKSNCPPDTDFLIAVQSEKFGHTGKLSTPEPQIKELLVQGDIVLFHRVGGYAIYKVRKDMLN